MCVRLSKTFINKYLSWIITPTSMYFNLQVRPLVPEEFKDMFFPVLAMDKQYIYICAISLCHSAFVLRLIEGMDSLWMAMCLY